MVNPVGRPTTYTPEIADEICVSLINGESLNRISRNPAMPCISTVYKWMREHPEFSKKYEQARADQVDTLADEMLEISDDGTNDITTKTNANGDEYEATNMEHIQRSRLRVDTRKWIAERMKPKKYGPKQDLNLGGQSDNPLGIQIIVNTVGEDA